MLTISADKLRSTAERTFVAAGATEDIARTVAGHLVTANLSGHDSHGVIRIPSYVHQIRTGHLDPKARAAVIRETPTTALVSGNWAFGQVAAADGTRVAIEKARSAHVGIVSIVQCNHIGRLGEYVEMAVAEGMIGMAMVGGLRGLGRCAAPYGGMKGALSTNPFACGIPASDGRPIIVDFATTIVAEGKLQVLRAKKEPVPLGWIRDRAGNPSTNVEDFYGGGTLALFGAHKGYGLALVTEVFSGILGGIELYQQDRISAGTFILVFDPSVFRPLADIAGDVSALGDEMRVVPPAPGFTEVLVPGDPERRSRARREVEGIPLPDDTWERLRQTARELGVGV
jgi:LDH2 family malate/lactate/ureidoglycolate dehydrogenase